MSIEELIPFVSLWIKEDVGSRGRELQDAWPPPRYPEIVLLGGTEVLATLLIREMNKHNISWDSCVQAAYAYDKQKST